MGSAARWLSTSSRRHPVATVAAVGVVVAALNVAWVAANRPLGSFNVDEAGYVATSLRYHRNLEVDTLRPLLDRLLETTTGPLVPLLGVPFLVVGSRTAGWAMAVQPLLHLLGAVAVAGVGTRLGGPRHGLVSGLLVLGLPGALHAARSYQLGAGAAAALTLATWALLASDRGRRRWPMLAAGLAVGAMLLTRTMTVVYLPGLAVAGVLLVERSRRAAVNAALGATVALAVAAPWWIAAWGDVWDYLLRYGYGDVSSDYGPEGLLDRIGMRLGGAAVDVRPLLLVPGLVAVALAIRHLRARSDARSVLRSERARPFLAVGGAVGTGYLILLTSSNPGVWFELPLELLCVPLVVGATHLLPPRPRRALAAVALGVAAINVALVGNWNLGRGGDLASAEGPRASLFLFGDLYEPATDLVAADERFGVGRGPRREASREWWEAHRDLVAELDRVLDDGTSVQTVTGSSALVNQGSLLLAEELLGTAIGPSEVPDTTATDLDQWLDPDRGLRRVLVVIRSQADPYPVDVRRDDLEDRARQLGWVEAAAVPLPDGGDVLVLTHGRAER